MAPISPVEMGLTRAEEPRRKMPWRRPCALSLTGVVFREREVNIVNGSSCDKTMALPDSSPQEIKAIAQNQMGTI